MMSLVVISANASPASSKRLPTEAMAGRNSTAEMTAETSTPM